MALTTVGFIGLGAMGRPMSQRVGAAGFSLVLLDLDRKRAEGAAAELNARVAQTGVELGRQVDAVITMLPSSDAVVRVLDGPDGVLAALRPGGLVIEMSSGNPGRTRELSERAAARGSTLIDAPVSGGVRRAKTGELAIMVGGDKSAIAIAGPLLRAMGTTILPTGPVGTAHAMKALNNLVSAGGFLIGIEALLIGRQNSASIPR